MPTERRRDQLGPSAGKERLSRGENKTDEAIDRVGFGLQEAIEVTVPGASTATVRHGLGAVPTFVSITPLEQDAQYALVSRGRESVTIRIADVDPRKFWVGFFG